jgi:hypothetical protein
MTQAATRGAIPTRFLPARVPVEVIRALTVLVQSRSDVPEAHLVAASQTMDGAETPTLLIVSDDPYVATRLGRELGTRFSPQARPELMLLHPDDPQLCDIRRLGGELKRGPSGFPWWLLFLGT